MQRKFYIARNHAKQITSLMESQNVSYIESGYSIKTLLCGHSSGTTLSKNPTSVFYLPAVDLFACYVCSPGINLVAPPSFTAWFG